MKVFNEIATGKDVVTTARLRNLNNGTKVTSFKKGQSFNLKNSDLPYFNIDLVKKHNVISHNKESKHVEYIDDGCSGMIATGSSKEDNDTQKSNYVGDGCTGMVV